MSKELFFDESDLIVSMTDKKGVIAYANDIFFSVAEYTREELLGKPHNIVRHPDMPRVFFKVVWDRLNAGGEIYGFVKNKSKNGNYYWVFAFLKPIIQNGEITKIISYRKRPSEYAKKIISDIYAVLLDYEKSHSLDETMKFLNGYLAQRGLSYDDFVDRLASGQNVTNIAAMTIDFQRYYNDHIIFKHSILKQVKEKKQDIVVADPCCCNFGKWLESVKGEQFVAHKSWSEVHRHHNHVHAKLQEYVNVSNQNATESQKQKILDEVAHDTELIFSNLKTVMNYCE